MTGPTSAQMVLRDPSVDFAVMETARGGILRAGLGYRRSDVAACLNVSEDHMGLGGINTLEEMARVKRVVVESATETVVLNADDIHCLRMADYVTAKTICYATMNADHALVKEHIRAGGRAVVLERGMNGDMITIYNNGTHLPVLWSHLIPATFEGKAAYNVQNAMFAAAMAFSFGVDLDNIRHGLRTFDTSFFQTPGRGNVFDEHAFKVILDYAHNPAAFTALSGLVDQMDIPGKRIFVISIPGDRRDEDVATAARILAPHFDVFICKADGNRRGRGHDEIPQLMRACLLENGVDASAIHIVPEEPEAVALGLNMAGEGDLLVINGDDTVRCWKQIIYFKDPNKVAEPAAAAKPRPIPAGMEDLITDADVIVRDERGVRLAREQGEGGD
jgi:cyanophycin synthetase